MTRKCAPRSASSRGRLTDALIQNARLEAERDSDAAFKLPAAIADDLADPQVARMLDAQRTLFAARRLARTGEQSVLRQRLEQLSNDLGSLDFAFTARTKEYEFAARELKNVLPLFEKGFVNQQRIGPLQRDVARLEGELGRLTSERAKAKSALAEADLKLAQSEKEFQSTVAEDLRKAQSQLAELNENRTGLEDKLARTEIRAPRGGRVNALAPTTEGGVITPASAIAQIIPDGEKLIVEVRIQPQDIDKVRGGLPAAVKFPAFNAKKTPRLEGIVTTVSPAQINDNSARQSGQTLLHSADRIARGRARQARQGAHPDARHARRGLHRDDAAFDPELSGQAVVRRHEPHRPRSLIITARPHRPTFKYTNIRLKIAGGALSMLQLSAG